MRTADPIGHFLLPQLPRATEHFQSWKYIRFTTANQPFFLLAKKHPISVSKNAFSHKKKLLRHTPGGLHILRRNPRTTQSQIRGIYFNSQRNGQSKVLSLGGSFLSRPHYACQKRIYRYRPQHSRAALRSRNSARTSPHPRLYLLPLLLPPPSSPAASHTP